MKKIFVNKNFYIENSDFFEGKESEFEEIIKNNLSFIIEKKNLKTFYLKLAMLSDYGGNSAPDLICVTSDYSFFGVIEIETKSHPLMGHVIPQLKRLVSVRYDWKAEEIFTHLNKHNKNFKLNKEKFIEMLNQVEPNFYVISNKYDSRWDSDLSYENVKFLSVSPFIDDTKKECLYIKKSQSNFQSVAFQIRWDSYWFELSDRTRSSFRQGSLVTADFNEQSFTFSVESKSDGYIFHPTGEKTIDTVFSEDVKNVKELRFINNKYFIY